MVQVLSFCYFIRFIFFCPFCFFSSLFALPSRLLFHFDILYSGSLQISNPIDTLSSLPPSSSRSSPKVLVEIPVCVTQAPSSPHCIICHLVHLHPLALCFFFFGSCLFLLHLSWGCSFSPSILAALALDTPFSIHRMGVPFLFSPSRLHSLWGCVGLCPCPTLVCWTAMSHTSYILSQYILIVSCYPNLSSCVSSMCSCQQMCYQQ